MKQGYLKHRISDTIRINSIVTLYYNEFADDFVFHGERHNFWEAVYVDKGTAIVIAGNETLKLPQGSLVFHKPNEFHAIKSDSENPPNVVVISFTTTSAPMSYFNGFHCTVPKELRYHIKEILENARITFDFPMKHGYLELLENPAIGGEQMIKMHLEQLLIELMRQNAGSFTKPKDITDNKIVSECIDFMENNLYNSININDICRATNYSRTYICTLFKNKTGKTVVEYYNGLRIDEAKMLIRKNVYTCAEISDMLGFNTPTYFSHVFAKHANMTPTEYKNSVK